LENSPRVEEQNNLSEQQLREPTARLLLMRIKNKFGQFKNLAQEFGNNDHLFFYQEFVEDTAGENLKLD